MSAGAGCDARRPVQWGAGATAGAGTVVTFAGLGKRPEPRGRLLGTIDAQGDQMSEQDTTAEQAASLGGSMAGAISGAKLGARLIPIPLVGPVVGGAAGAVLGSEVGKRIGKAVFSGGNAFVQTLREG